MIMQAGESMVPLAVRKDHVHVIAWLVSEHHVDFSAPELVMALDFDHFLSQS